MSEWNGELRLVAIDADRVVFHRLPEEEMKLSLGRRYACALVEINDQEQLAPHEPERTGAKRLKRSPSNIAAILAKDRRFQVWARNAMKARGDGHLPANEETATEYIRRACSVVSRAELDIRPEALAIFHGIELEYYRSLQV